MEEEIFKTKPSIIGFIRFWIMRIVAAAAVIFSVYSYNENTVFFSILIASAAAVFLLCGSKQISIYKTHIKVHTDSIIKNSPFNNKFLLSDLKEISAEIPHEVSESILSKEYPLSSRHRLVIIPKDDIQRTFWIMTTREDLQKSVSLINEMIGTSSKFPKIILDYPANPLVS